MKRNYIFILFICFIVVSIVLISLKTNSNIQEKKECNNQQGCPEKQKKAETNFFMNPLNRFIVAA
jgi:preprotein translocase subunit SecG